MKPDVAAALRALASWAQAEGRTVEEVVTEALARARESDPKPLRRDDDYTPEAIDRTAEEDAGPHEYFEGGQWHE